MVHTDTFAVSTSGLCDVHDITPELSRVVAESQVRQGIACVACAGSTAAITTIEFEPGVVKDLQELLEKLVPHARSYHHDATWGDANGYAHLRSALLGTSLAVPVEDGRPVLGTWQQVVLVDFDNRPRKRSLTVVVSGE
uniref:YjbQ family protein n=1 Tax=candidate division WOR-3 bacterium TaxID=2052148 RepID=A0A7C4CCX5_UNCW3